MKTKIALITLLVLAVAAFIYVMILPHQAARKAIAGAAPNGQGVYYCPMHPNYHADKPGNCPICGMKLETANAPAAPSAEAPPSQIQVSPEKQQLIGMRSVAAQFGTLTKEIRAVGKISYDETRVTHIHTKVSGYIEQVYADYIGKSVTVGEPLFTIYSPDLVATQQDYLLALRSRNLLQGSTLASAAQGSENLIAAARERLRLWDVTDEEIRAIETEGKIKRAIAVNSPVSGVVVERAAYHHGTFVDPTKDLFTIVDLSHVWVLGEIYETDLPFIRVRQTAEIELPSSGSARTLHGIVDFVYPFIDPKTRTVQVRMQFPNADLSLKPEMFVNIRFVVSLGRQLLVPQDAVMDTGTEQYVFIDLGNGYLQPRLVKVSAQSGDMSGIQQGLKAGERVVTAANFVVDSDSRLKGAFANMGKPAATQGVPVSPSTQTISAVVLEPRTAKTGLNPIRVLVKDASGNPITGAQVDVTLSMPQMGSMAPMSSRSNLSESGNGIYSGQVEFQMAWTWQTSITVRKNGNVIGTVQTSITAK